QDRYPGIGRYTVNLLHALIRVEPDLSLALLHDPTARNISFDLSGLQRQTRIAWVPCLVPLRSWQGQVDVPMMMRRLRLDLFHAPYYVRPYLTPCPSVVTIYDVISRLHPKGLPSVAARWAFEAATRLALLSSQRIIVPSETTAADLRRYYQVKAARLRVIPGAADPAFRPLPQVQVWPVLERLGLPQPYVLYLGTNKPHKNLTRLIQAWAQVVAGWSGTPPPLVVAGHEDPRYPQARQTAEQLGLGGRVRWLSSVPGQALPALVAGAEAFVFPSLYEGFGLPVLEALACGVPVACSDTPALRELAGPAATYYDPRDLSAMAEGISELLRAHERRRALREAGLARAGEYSWERAAKQTLAVYQEALAERPRGGGAAGAGLGCLPGRRLPPARLLGG
ncbi:MAG: glycosyltransferase family 4 protein, partial [Chloroflexi bacterium]|nr:glycosyltransferase family 4 protein [Chloroflexota bacterium]